jgi:CheY-like chemotaxis protein
MMKQRSPDLRLSLRRAGFDYLVAYDSPAALALFDSQQRALVLCDINLPQLTGLESPAMSAGSLPMAPVTLMTSRRNPGVTTQAIRSGAAPVSASLFPTLA